MSHLTIVILALIACALIGVSTFYMHFRKRESLKAAPLIPWIIPSLIALGTGFMLLVHLVNLMGIDTGRR